MLLEGVVERGKGAGARRVGKGGGIRGVGQQGEGVESILK